MDERSGQRILLCAPALHEREYPACIDLLVDDHPSDVRAVFVSHAKSPDEIRERWERHAGALPAAFGIITLDQFTRSSDPSRPSYTAATHAGSVPAQIESVHPSNLTELGVRVSDLLDTWADRDTSLALCFDSITALSQHVSHAELLRFIQAVGQQAKTAGATAHFHLDPDAVPDETVAAIKGAMDHVVDCRDEPAIDG